jgi:outer membrane autotransporter protein
MAGQYLSNSYDLLGSGTKTRFDVPFVGVYAVATGFGFFADVQFRHDFWNADITNYRAGLNEKPLEGRGWAGSASIGYHWALPNDWFIEPSAAINVTSVDFDRLQVAAGTTPAYLVLDTVRSTLGRVGLRAGTSFVLDNKYAFQPFASVSGWNEFETSLKESFQQNVTYVPISVSRSGAFAQFGLGVSAQIIDTGWVGFLRGDYRTGEKLTGAALNGGVSYRF